MWNEKNAAKEKGSLFGPEYPDYILGILIFALTVVAYTTYGGFWAVTWTDVLQGIVIVVGAVLLMVLALNKVGGLNEATSKLQQIDPKLVTGPGPNNYLPVGLAISFFFLWTIGSMGQPVGMVRLMACRDTPTLRISLFMIGFYYALIYLPLIITFICARALYPTEFLRESDSIMPVMALRVTEDMPLVGGLILAAPYAAAMSAVAGFLLLMSSSLVRDIYQRNINPDISAGTVKKISYGTTAVVGIIVTFAAFHPPHFLQYLIIFTGAGMACTFLAPTVFALYWKRATRAGALAGLVSGFSTVAILYVLGWMGVGKPTVWPTLSTSTVGLLATPSGSGPILAVSTLYPNRTNLGPAAEPFAPLYLFNLDPVLHGLAVSFALGIIVSLFTQPLPKEHVDRYFLVETPPDGRFAEAIAVKETGVMAEKGPTLKQRPEAE
jgi:sodium/pantothenate symporter